MAKKIMCVDDSTTIRKLVKKAMEPEGYIIIEAENGKDGIAKCAEGEIDLFLGDVNMPEMDGFAFVEHLKKDPAFSKHPIIFLTTESSPQKKEKGKELGVNGWIVKPFEPQVLQKVVGMLLS